MAGRNSWRRSWMSGASPDATIRIIAGWKPRAWVATWTPSIFPWHLDIGEQHMKKSRPDKLQSCLVTGRGLFDLKTLVSEKLSGHQPDKVIVLDEQDTQPPTQGPPDKAFCLCRVGLDVGQHDSGTGVVRHPGVPGFDLDQNRMVRAYSSKN